MGLATPSHKNLPVTETTASNTIAMDPPVDSKQPTGSMPASDESLPQEVKEWERESTWAQN